MIKYIAKKELIDQDWKTQLAKGYSNIPEGAECEFIKKINNFYGTYALVNYNGNNYYVHFQDIERVLK